jgi:hypothetical protein
MTKNRAVPKSRGVRRAASRAMAAADLGLLTPRAGDRKIDRDEDPAQTIAEVQLTCDDNTGVFFFRHQRTLFLRVVEFD